MTSVVEMIYFQQLNIRFLLQDPTRVISLVESNVTNGRKDAVCDSHTTHIAHSICYGAQQTKTIKRTW